MTKKEYCESHQFIGWYTVIYFITVYIHGFEYGIEDYMYASIVTANVGGGTSKTYHKWKIRTTAKGRMYVKTKFGRIYLDDCFRNLEANQYPTGSVMRSLSDI